MAEIAKGFARLPVLLEVDEQRHSVGTTSSSANHVLVDEIQPIAQQPAADEDRVLAGRLAHQADVAVVGPGAAVGAAGHAQREHFLRQPEPGQLDFQLIDHARQAPARLR